MIASKVENASFQQVKTNFLSLLGLNSQVGCTFSKHVVMSCITAVRAKRFVTVSVMWQPGSSLQPMWQELLHMFCFIYVFSSLNLSRRLRWSFWRLNRPRPSCPTYHCNVKISNKQLTELQSCRPIQGWVWSNRIGMKWCLAWCPVVSQHLDTQHWNREPVSSQNDSLSQWRLHVAVGELPNVIESFAVIGTLLPLPIQERKMSDIYENNCWWWDFSLNKA